MKPAGCLPGASSARQTAPRSAPPTFPWSFHPFHPAPSSASVLLPHCRLEPSRGQSWGHGRQFGSWRCDGDANRRDHLDLSLWTTWTLGQIKGLRGLPVAVLRSPATRSTDVRVYSRSAKKVGRRSSSGALNVAAHAAGCGKGRKMRPLSGGILYLSAHGDAEWDGNTTWKPPLVY